MPDISEELESLRRENARLRKLLKLTDAEAAPARDTQAAWFDKAPGPVDANSSPQAKVDFYAALFGARTSRWIGSSTMREAPRHGDPNESARAADGKADFDHIYDRPDPRAYFRTLREFDYEIPQRAEPVFRGLLTALRSQPQVADAEPVRVLDLCCSYGINAALLRCDVSLDELFDRYTSPALDELSPAELSRADKEYYAERRGPNAVSVSGLDLAANAVAYGCRVGLLDDGWAEDLEHGDPSDQLTDHLDGVDLVTTTGGVGYITERTFDRVVGASRGDSMPWVAAFALRMYSYDRIAETLARHGLVTEQLTGVTFPQRRFVSEAEREDTLRQVSERGLDPSGLEDTGRYHADFYLSRPASDTQQPIKQLLDGAVPQ